MRLRGIHNFRERIRQPILGRTGLHKPIIGVLITSALAVINYQASESQLHNQITAGLVAVSFLFVASVIAILTEEWYWRAVAVMIALGGTGLVYALIFGRGAEYINLSQHVTTSIIRAALDFASVLLLFCTAQFLVEFYRGKPVGRFTDYLDLRRFYRKSAAERERDA